MCIRDGYCTFQSGAFRSLAGGVDPATPDGTSAKVGSPYGTRRAQRDGTERGAMSHSVLLTPARVPVMPGKHSHDTHSAAPRFPEFAACARTLLIHMSESVLAQGDTLYRATLLW